MLDTARGGGRGPGRDLARRPVPRTREPQGVGGTGNQDAGAGHTGAGVLPDRGFPRTACHLSTPHLRAVRSLTRTLGGAEGRGARAGAAFLREKAEK